MKVRRRADWLLWLIPAAGIALHGCTQPADTQQADAPPADTRPADTPPTGAPSADTQANVVPGGLPADFKPPEGWTKPFPAAG